MLDLPRPIARVADLGLTIAAVLLIAAALALAFSGSPIAP